MTIFVVQEGKRSHEIHFTMKTIAKKFGCSCQSVYTRIREEDGDGPPKKSRIFGNARIFKLHTIPEIDSSTKFYICENCPYAVEEGNHLCHKCEAEEELKFLNKKDESDENQDEDAQGEDSSSEGGDSSDS